jgi:hypothetical protein
MAKNRQKEQMTRLGLYAVTPFVIAAAALWLSPYVIPQYIALDFHQIALVYGAVFVAYLSGAGAGATLNPGQKLRESFLPGQLIVLFAFVAIIPSGVFFISMPPVWRHTLILVLLIYLLMRDMNATRAGLFPAWYGALRTRVTFWAGLSLIMIISRLTFWNYY